MSVTITIIDSDATSRAGLMNVLEREKLAKDCAVAADDANIVGGSVLVLAARDENTPQSAKINENNNFTKPVRVGIVLDRIKRLLSAERVVDAKNAIIGKYELDVIGNELRSDKGLIVRLTEKEKNILLALFSAGGEVVERQTLLESVWGYAEGLETHTLETHIYRLRQKIEEDPAKPAILITDGAGYKIR